VQGGQAEPDEGTGVDDKGRNEGERPHVREGVANHVPRTARLHVRPGRIGSTTRIRSTCAAGSQR